MSLDLLLKNRLSKKEIKAIPYLLKNYSRALISCGAVSFPEYLKYFINSTDYFLHKNKKSYLLIVKNKKDILGMSLLRFMDWDSNFFKTDIACIEYILTNRCPEREGVGGTEKQLLKSGLELAKRLGIKILYTSINSASCPLVNILMSLKFNFLCAEMERIISRKDFSSLYLKGGLGRNYRFRKYKKEDYSQIMEIAEEISEDVKSKFSLIPYLPQKEKENYYLESIKNCCLGRNADRVFVAIKNGVAVGFIAYRYNRIFEESLGRKMAFVAMGGISRSERQKNVGTYFFRWAHRQTFKTSDIISGKVYLHNLPMMRLILTRRPVSPFGFTYTFCKKL